MRIPAGTFGLDLGRLRASRISAPRHRRADDCRAWDRAKTLGFPAILLCGDPDYYKRQGFLPAEVFVSARRTTCISQRSRPASYRSTRFAAQRGAIVRTRSTPWTPPPRWHSTGISHPRLRLTVRLLKSDSRHLLPCTVKQIRNCAQMADLGFSFKNADRRSSEVLYGYLKNQRQPMYPPVAGIGLRRASISALSEQAAFSYGVPLY